MTIDRRSLLKYAGLAPLMGAVPRAQAAGEVPAERADRRSFHCHQQLHMDFGFMALFHYV